MFCQCMSDRNNDSDNLLLFTVFLFVIGFVTLYNNNIAVVPYDFVFVIICIVSCFVLFLKRSLFLSLFPCSVLFFV